MAQMRICGISFDSTNAALAIIDCSHDGAILPVDCQTKRIPLDDHEDHNCLRSFLANVNVLVRDFSVDSIAIRKCTYSGTYQSGAPSLKMEALLQVADVPTVLISPHTVTSRCKSAKVAIPPNLRKYQHDAFNVAVAYATEHMSEAK